MDCRPNNFGQLTYTSPDAPVEQVLKTASAVRSVKMDIEHLSQTRQSIL